MGFFDKMKEKTLNQRTYFVCGVFLAGIFVLLFYNGSPALAFVGCALVFAGVVLDVKLIRCPRCGRWLGIYPRTPCRWCKQSFDYKEK